MSGQSLRFNRLIDNTSGRSFMIAVDHGMIFGPLPGLENARETVATVISCEPDAVVLGPGLLAATDDLFAHRGAPAIVLRTDFLIAADPLLYVGDAHRSLISAKDAQAMGADAIMMFLSLETGGTVFPDNLKTVADTISEARALGLPAIVEVVPWGQRGTGKPVDFELLKTVCRIAAEAGASAVKTVYPGTPERMRALASSIPVPLFVLGGPKEDAPGALEKATGDAIDNGAVGAVYGRNIWQSPDPRGVADTIRGVVHRELSLV